MFGSSKTIYRETDSNTSLEDCIGNLDHMIEDYQVRFVSYKKEYEKQNKWTEIRKKKIMVLRKENLIHTEEYSKTCQDYTASKTERAILEQRIKDIQEFISNLLILKSRFS